MFFQNFTQIQIFSPSGSGFVEEMRRPSENNIIAAAISPALKLAVSEGN
jgi:hypothetical protein